MAGINDTIKYLLNGQQNDQQNVPTGTGMSMTEMINSISADQRKRGAYQKNLQNLNITNPQEMTSRQLLGSVSLIRQNDPYTADEIMNNFSYLQTDPNSRFYNPYTQPTNKAVSNLAAYGFDTNNLNDAWFNQNNGWISSNLVYNGTTNTPSKPGKKATQDQKIAYELYQYQKSEAATKKAEQQWEALQQELTYWAQRKDRNYSDEEILQKIDWSKYGELTSMKDNMYMQPNEYNRAIGYSDDAVYGVLWAARNPEYKGDIYGAMANSALGNGNVWKYDPEIAEKLDPKSDKFNPYSAGGTNIDDAAVYFGVSSFDENWLKDHADLAWSDDETEKKMYNTVWKAEENQKKAEEEYAALTEFINKKLNYLKNDPEKILGKINWSDYPTLAAMDKSMGKDDTPGTGDLVAMTRGLNYKYADLKQMVYDLCAEQNAKETGTTYSYKVKGSASVSDTPIQPTVQEEEIAKAEDQVMAEGAEIAEPVAEASEKEAMNNQRSVTYDMVKDTVSAIKQMVFDAKSLLTQNAIRNSVSRTSSAILEGSDTIAAFEADTKEIEDLSAREAELKESLGILTSYGKEINDFGKVLFDYEGNQIQLNYRYDEESNEYVVHSMYNLTTGSKDVSNLQSDAFSDRVNGYLNSLGTNRNNIIEANEQPITEEQQALVDEYNDVHSRLMGLYDQHEQDRPAYDEAVADMESAQKVRDMTISLLEAAGVSAEDLQDFENTGVVIDAIKRFTENDPTVWESYNVYDLYAQAYLFNGDSSDGFFTEDGKLVRYSDVFNAAKAGDEENQQEIETVRWMLDYADRVGIQIPDGVRANMERYIAKLERNHKDYEYFAMVGNDDFKSGAEHGRQILQDGELFDWSAYSESGSVEGLPLWDILSDEQKQNLLKADQDYKNGFSSSETMVNMYENMTASLPIEQRMFGLAYLDNLLTDYEKDTYYYILGTEGVDAAEEYYRHLSDDYGVLNKRYDDLAAEFGEEMASGTGVEGFLKRRAADVMSMIMAPGAAIGSFVYGIDQGIKKLTGQKTEFNPHNPWLSFNTFRKSARAEINRGILEAYGKKDENGNYQPTLLSTLATGLQEMISNRGDSVMNMLTFGGLTSGISNAILQEFIGAVPMATSAAFDAMAEAKEKGATEEQLWAIGGITFLCESITEAVTYSNIQDAFGAGDAITKETIGGFLKDWLTQNGIEEAFGESLTEILEYAADKGILGGNSDHAEMVAKYIADGMTEEEADAAAWRDEMSNVLRTALISYLSPGLDIFSFGAGRLNYYRNETRYAQEHGANVSLLDVMRADKGIRDRVDAGYESLVRAPEAQQTTQTAEQASEADSRFEMEDVDASDLDFKPAQTETAPEEGAGTAVSENEEVSPETTAAQEIAKDYETLEASKDADQSSQTATIASVLDTEGTEESSDTANAAAAKLDTVFEGESPVEAMQDLMLGAHESGTDSTEVKQAVQNAALSSKSEAIRMMHTTEYKTADLDQKASMLASTVKTDAANPEVQSDIAKSVLENRVAREELNIIKDGALGEARKAQEAADDAAKTVQAAQEELEVRQADLEAKGQNLLTANEEFQQDPGNPAKADMVNHALSELQKSSEVEQEYQQQLANAKERQQKALAEAKRVLDAAMTAIRQQAQQNIAQQNQQRADQQAIIAQAAQEQAVQEAQAKADQEATDNATTADADTYIEQFHPDATEEEKQKIREMFNRIAQEKPAESTVRDENGQLSEEAKKNRDKFIKRVSDKFGVQIDIMDTTQGGVVDRQNGYVDLKNNRIVLDETATMDDAMFFVLGHELTHIAEKSGTYSQLAQSLLRMRYGTDEGRLAADIRARKALYDFRLARMHEQDNTIDATPLTEEQAAQEIVADIMGDLLRGDQDLVNRLVSEEPSLARRILDSIKSFIKKATGMKGAWLSNAQRTVDMLEAALNEATGKEIEQEASKKFSIKKASPHLSDQIKAVSDQLDQMQVVKSVSSKIDLSPYEGTGKSREAQIKLWAQDKAEEFGRSITRPGFGTVEINNSAISRIFSYLGYKNDAATAAFEAIPEVIKNGIDAGVDLQHKGRPVDAYTFAAPIEVDGIRGNMGVILHRSKDGDTFKTYKVLLPDGRELVIYNEETELAQQDASEGAPHADSVSKEIVPQEDGGVKTLVKDDQGNDSAISLRGDTVDASPTIKRSLSSFTPEEQQKVRDSLLKSGRFTAKEVDKYLNDALGIASIIAADRGRLDFAADPGKTMLKPNAEYVKTLDASTLCAKRLLYQGTFDAIQHALPNTPLLPEDLIDLANMMREMGYETPCGICYVESRRRQLGKFTDQWLESYDGEYKPTIDQVTTSDGLEELRKTHPQAYQDFVSAMNKKGTMNPKVVQLRTDYRGEIRDMTAGQIQKVKDIGGLRVQSFSDFETPHLLDMAQAVMDMASKGLTAQAYTKVPNFPWAFGDTGIKINLSLIGKGTGLDENGNLVFDDVEGMPFDEAMKLRDRYSQNVGTILVGINDDHIKAAMADPRIDFIIPFHKSGWSKEELSKMPVLNSYSDYTDSQNEKKIVGRDKKGGYKTESLEKSKSVNFQPVGENGYWDFSKSGKENAEAYLKLCAEDGRLPKFSQFLVDNGDGSFSLQPDGSTDGYWKTLIDFKMYDNDGNGAPQQEVTPNINMPEANRILSEYSLDRNGISRKSNNDLPVAQPVVDRYVEEYKAKNPREKYSLPATEQDKEYSAAVDHGDMEEAQRLVDEKANEAGYTIHAYHGTSRGDRVGNVFLPERATSGPMAFFTDDREIAESYSRNKRDTSTAYEEEYQDYHTQFRTTGRGGKDIAVEKLWSQLNIQQMMKIREAGKHITWDDDMENIIYDPKAENGNGGYSSHTLRECHGNAIAALVDAWLDSGELFDQEEKFIDVLKLAGVENVTYKDPNETHEKVYDTYLKIQNPFDVSTMYTGNFLEELERWWMFQDKEQYQKETMNADLWDKNNISVDEWIRDGFADVAEGRTSNWTRIPDGVTAYLKELGFDGIKDRGGKYTGYGHTVWIPFSSEQIKSAEAVVRDNQGNIIPLSERFNDQSPDIRYSLPVRPSDAPYLSAINHGNMEEAQRLVDEKAKESGFNVKVYHGTANSGRFNVFDPAKLSNSKLSSQIGQGFYFTNSKEGAKEYTSQHDIYGNRKAGRNPYLFEGYLKIENPIEITEYSHNLPYDTIRNIIADGNKEWHFESGIAHDLQGTTIDGKKYTKDEIKAMSKDEKIDLYTQHLVEQGDKYALQHMVDAYKLGDQGLLLEAMKKYTGNDGIHWQMHEGLDQFVAFDSSQFKDASPVTYDDDGNVIPLSERFNTESPDIRYSLPSDNLLEQQIRQYLASGGSLSTNTTPPGSNLPGTPGMRPQRQFGRQTAQRSNALHDEVKDYLYNHSSYTPDSNQEQINRALDWVQNMSGENDPDGYYAALRRVTSDNFDYRSADGQARMLTVMSMAALKAEAGDQSALNDELRLADAFNKQGTDLGRQLQARKIFRLMTPLGRVAALESMQDHVNEDLERRGRTARVSLSPETVNEAANAQTEEEFEKARKKAAQELAKQVPANWKDKLRGWRMLSMLGNPRTHIRNIIGNAFFVPVVSLKNKLGAVGEIVTRQDQRTKTMAPVLSKEVRNFAKQDALTMKDTLTGEAKYNEQSAVEREQKPFKGLLQAIIDFNGDMLEKEDWTFLKGHYKRALGGWMQANGYTAEQLSSNPQLLEQGRTYAIQEAQKATYRDFNGLAAKLNEMTRNPKTTGQAILAFGTEAVLPFKKTPANILKRGIEYSPAGIMRSLTTDLYHLKQWNDYQKGKLTALPEKAISPNQFIDRICSGLSGSAILAVGALLGHAGIVTCGLDDDEDKLEKEQGNQKYAIKFSIAGQDFTFTVDWAAPMSMPFFVGAAIQEQLANQKGFDIEELVNAFGNISEPVFNLSMLDGVNSLFKTSQYDDTDTITQIGAKIVSNYATSYVPSLLGAIARTVDDTRRKAYVESGKGTGVLGTFRYAYEQTQNKIPGWSQTNIPTRDVFGNPETSGLAERILENFILPGYVSNYKNDPVLNEMARLYDVTGDPSMIPKDPSKSVSYKNEKYVLTAEQWDQYKAERGQAAYKALTELINSQDYQEANETTQAQMIKDVWSYADKVGKKAIIPDFEMEDLGDTAVQTLARDAKVTVYKTDMITALSSGDFEGYDTMVEALHEAGVEDSTIKTKIGDTYRDQWKDAYRKGDYERMAEIENVLDYTGFDFNIYGKNGWEDKVIEEYGD